MQKKLFLLFILFYFVAKSQDSTLSFPDTNFSVTDTSKILNDSTIFTDSLPQVDTTTKIDSLGFQIPNDSTINYETDLSKIIDPEGYRGMRWGMTQNEVKEFVLNLDTNINFKNFDPITNGFEYTKRVASASALISYQFDYDRLYIIRIKLILRSANKFDYLDKYEEILNILKSKYGNFTRTGYSKIDDTYLSTIESVILGYAKKYTLWDFERTFINLMLTGSPKKNSLEIKITYGSKPIIFEMKDRKEILKYDDF